MGPNDLAKVNTGSSFKFGFVFFFSYTGKERNRCSRGRIKVVFIYMGEIAACIV